MRKFVSFIPFLLLAICGYGQDTWTQTGPVKFPQNPSVQTTGMGRTTSLTFHPTDTNIIYATTASGGLWRTSNKGATWHQLTDFLPYSQTSCLLINPKNPNVMYLGTGDPNYYYSGLGVWKTCDGGANWSQQTSGMGNILIIGLLMDPNDTSTIVAATDNGIYKSNDAGNTWTSKAYSGMDLDLRDMKLKPFSNETIYVSSNNNIYISHNFGETWALRTYHSINDTMAITKISVTPADSNLLYAVCFKVNGLHFGGLWKSTNSGNSFTVMSADSPQILGYSSDGSSNDGQWGYNLTITADPNVGGIVYVGAINIWKSADSGSTWALKSYWPWGVHADKHCFIFSPHKTEELYITHDGGIDRSTDSGNTWTRISDGLSASEFYTLGQSPLHKELAKGGLQDNGVDLYKDNIFYTVQGGDGTHDYLFDNENENYDYEQTTAYRHDDNNYSYADVGTAGISCLHPTDSNVMFCGVNYLLRSQNIRDSAKYITWTKISDSVHGVSWAKILSISCSRLNRQVLYYSDWYGDLYRSDNILNSTPTYTALTPPVSGTYVTQVLASPLSATTVYISQGVKVYSSKNLGVAWTDISSGLPGTNVTKMVADPLDVNKGIYAMTAFGVYYRNETMGNWILYSKSLPSICSTSDLEIYSDSTKGCLRLSTYGRGVWQSTLYRNRNAAPVANFTVNSTSIMQCADVYILNDASEGVITSRKWQITPNSGYVFINGTDSTTRNPEIEFTKPGNYFITLTVRNAAGTNMNTQTVAYSVPGMAACLPNTTNLGWWNMAIIRYQFNTINNYYPGTISTNPDVLDFSCTQSTVVKPGTTYKAYITNYDYNKQYANIYIDYNNDGDFSDTGDLVASIGPDTGTQVATIKIPVLPKVVGKFLRMRVMTDYYPISSPCGPLGYGETQDYAVMIDGRRPTVSINIPQPTVSSSFNALFTLSQPTNNFDSTAINVKNGLLKMFRQIGPASFIANIIPTSRGMVAITAKAGLVTGLNGLTNNSVADSTLFFLGIDSFGFPGLSVFDSLTQTPTGGIIHSYLPYGTLTDSLVPHFVLSDSSSAYVGSKVQKSFVTVNNFSQPLVYKIVAKDTSLKYYYTAKVFMLPDTNCSMYSFGFSNPSASGIITQNQYGGTVDITVPYGTNISQLTAFFTVDSNTIVTIKNIKQVSGSTVNNFTNIITYNISAQNIRYQKQYRVRVTIAKNTADNLLSFRYKGLPDSGTITSDTTGGIVNINVPFGANLNGLIPVFTLSNNASAFVNNTLQKSGISSGNFTDTVVYKIISEDSLHFKYFKIVTHILPDTACELLSFGFANPAVMGTITTDSTGGEVDINLPSGTNTSALVPVFTISDSARAFIKGIKQISGITANNFIDTVIYTIEAQDTFYKKIYKVVASTFTGIANTPDAQGFKIYPNPSEGMLYIGFNFKTANKTGIRLYNSFGQLVVQQDEYVLAGSTIALDLSSLAKGLYLLRIGNEVSYYTMKVILIHGQ